MGDYRRMGNLGQHLPNATLATTSLHYQLSNLWRSPRGTVLRIEALALVAIAFSFFLAAFGSCRRWSNRWIVQKGFLAAQVLSLSLGTYSIGLMQSSSVKSEMYPIWAVSLFTLFGCVDPVTTYIGLDYKGPLLKVIFQLCLYCGYVLLMTVSTNFGRVGKLAIGMLSAITFIKGFYRSLALVLPSRMRNKLGELDSTEAGALAGYGNGNGFEVYLRQEHIFSRISMAHIHSSRDKMLGKLKIKEVTANGIEDVCLGYSLSHLLRRHFLGLDTAREMELKREKFESLVQARPGIIDYKRALKAIEAELAFLYEVFFTSNEFLHCYEARTSSFWAFSSFIGICFLGVATAIPGTMTTSPDHASTSAGAGTTVVVHTTVADLMVTLFILVSLALLQLLQLIRCWTSNWARVAFACEVAITNFGRTNWLQRMVWKFKVFWITRMNWFDKYLWQDKIGQYSLVDGAAISKRGPVRPHHWQEQPHHCQEEEHLCCSICETPLGMVCMCLRCLCCLLCGPCHPLVWSRDFTGCGRLGRMLGLQYIGQVARELWVCDDTSTAARLQDNIKASIADFLGQVKSRRIGTEWSSLFVDNGIGASYLPYKNAPLQDQVWVTNAPFMERQIITTSDAYAFTHRVMVWHIATSYCEEQGRRGAAGGEEEDSRRVAIALSKYCAYLVVSAPELLPGPSAETKRAFDRAAESTGKYWPDKGDEMPPPPQEGYYAYACFDMGVYLGRRLLRESSADPWKLLALLWVQTLLYAAPYGDVQAHMQRLSQGGEFITHLWALLYHLGIHSWEHQEDEDDAQTVERKAAAAAAAAAGEREPRQKEVSALPPRGATSHSHTEEICIVD